MSMDQECLNNYVIIHRSPQRKKSNQFCNYSSCLASGKARSIVSLHHIRVTQKKHAVPKLYRDRTT